MSLKDNLDCAEQLMIFYYYAYKSISIDKKVDEITISVELCDGEDDEGNCCSSCNVPKVINSYIKEYKKLGNKDKTLFDFLREKKFATHNEKSKNNPKTQYELLNELGNQSGKSNDGGWGKGRGL